MLLSDSITSKSHQTQLKLVCYFIYKIPREKSLQNSKKKKKKKDRETYSTNHNVHCQDSLAYFV